MKHSQEEIIKALKVINEECEDIGECKDCPFGTREGECLIDESYPGEWRINDDDLDTWKGLL